jgi:flagellar assembly protein FliH
MASTDSSFYCFPDLSRKEGKGSRRMEPAAPAFRRMSSGNPAAGGSRFQSPGIGESARAGKARAEHIEDLEQAAYCRGFSDGEKNGFEQGERAGREAAQSRLEPVLQSLNQMLAELETLQRREGRCFEKELVDLALAVARKIVGRELAVKPEAVAGMLREALGRVEHAGRLSIRMNPDDLQRLADVRPRLLEGLSDPARVRFEADATLSAGGCFIESEAGDIDARLERRFQIVEDAFRAEAQADAAMRGQRS